MANEILRKMAYKRVRTPGGSEASGGGSGGGPEVKVPVITEITFKDPVDRGQESTYTINNKGEAWRNIHVAWVGDKNSTDATENADPNQQTPSDCIAVERIDKWRVKDAVDRGQETYPQPDNKTYDPHGPPYFTTHIKTHVVRYINEPDDGNFVESELIDGINYKDPVDRGQQTHYTLSNPPDNSGIDGLILGTTTDDQGNNITTVAVDPSGSLADVTDSGSSVDPPYRFDPFQNIVRVRGHVYKAPYNPLCIIAEAGGNYDFSGVMHIVQTPFGSPIGTSNTYAQGVCSDASGNLAGGANIHGIGSGTPGEQYFSITPNVPLDPGLGYGFDYSQYIGSVNTEGLSFTVTMLENEFQCGYVYCTLIGTSVCGVGIFDFSGLTFTPVPPYPLGPNDFYFPNTTWIASKFTGPAGYNGSSYGTEVLLKPTNPPQHFESYMDATGHFVTKLVPGNLVNDPTTGKPIVYCNQC